MRGESFHNCRSSSITRILLVKKIVLTSRCSSLKLNNRSRSRLHLLSVHPFTFTMRINSAYILLALVSAVFAAPAYVLVSRRVFWPFL